MQGEELARTGRGDLDLRPFTIAADGPLTPAARLSFGKSGSNRNVPTQRAMERGYFEVKETAVTHADGRVSINRTPKVTGKGQRHLLGRYCGGVAAS